MKISVEFDYQPGDSVVQVAHPTDVLIVTECSLMFDHRHVCRVRCVANPKVLFWVFSEELRPYERSSGFGEGKP